MWNFLWGFLIGSVITVIFTALFTISSEEDSYETCTCALARCNGECEFCVWNIWED